MKAQLEIKNCFFATSLIKNKWLIKIKHCSIRSRNNELSKFPWLNTMRARPTEKVIEDLLVATYGYKSSIREQYNFRQALYCLVQLAKAEQVLEIKTNVRKLTGTAMSLDSRRKTKSLLRQVEATALHGQRHLEFDKTDDGNGE